MEATEKIILAEENIRQALADYRRHTSQTVVLDDVSESFVKRLAKDNYYAKQELRELFRKSPVWDEKLDALVINGTRTHDPDYSRIESLARQMLAPAFRSSLSAPNYDELAFNITKAIYFFISPDLTDEQKGESIAAINTLAPKAYAPGKKPSRIFRALCTALGVADETTGSDFQYLFAQFADEITSHKIDFKLFVSLNPAHFVTMSNPKHDDRGCTLTSCHSFNSTEYSYNNGCTGYARDNYTFIVFTVVDPTNAETLNNRKNMRQIFCYKPGNGVLLQSRLYNNAGGTHREMSESKVYRDLVQREISALEERPNLWRTFKYYDNREIEFRCGDGFGGYPDWTYRDFDAKVSIRKDHEDDYKAFEIGTYGLCVSCGSETSAGVYCGDCEGSMECDSCGGSYHEDELYEVYDQYGDTVYVCEDCRDQYYTRCEECGDYYHNSNVTQVQSGYYVCEACLNDNYVQCDDCGEWVHEDGVYHAVLGDGKEVYVCGDCIDEHFTKCDDCGTWVIEDGLETVYDEDGDARHVGPCCIDNYREYENCGRLFESGLLECGLCPDCAAEIAAEDAEAEKEEIA